MPKHKVTVGDRFNQLFAVLVDQAPESVLTKDLAPSMAGFLKSRGYVVARSIHELNGTTKPRRKRKVKAAAPVKARVKKSHAPEPKEA